MGRHRQKRSRKAKETTAWVSCVDWTVDEARRLVAVDEFGHRLAIIQLDGTVTFLGHKGTGPGEFHYPRSIEILNKIAYVVDCWNHRVQMFELPEWTFKGSFGDGSDLSARLFCPSWITVVERDNGSALLLIADTNHNRLAFYDPTGLFLFDSELQRSRHPTKIRMQSQQFEVQSEDGLWESVC